jgi:hypothetical protein
MMAERRLRDGRWHTMASPVVETVGRPESWSLFVANHPALGGLLMLLSLLIVVGGVWYRQGIGYTVTPIAAAFVLSAMAAGTVAAARAHHGLPASTAMALVMVAPVLLLALMSLFSAISVSFSDRADTHFSDSLRQAVDDILLSGGPWYENDRLLCVLAAAAGVAAGAGSMMLWVRFHPAPPPAAQIQDEYEASPAAPAASSDEAAL